MQDCGSAPSGNDSAMLKASPCCPPLCAPASAFFVAPALASQDTKHALARRVPRAPFGASPAFAGRSHAFPLSLRSFGSALAPLPLRASARLGSGSPLHSRAFGRFRRRTARAVVRLLAAFFNRGRAAGVRYRVRLSQPSAFALVWACALRRRATPTADTSARLRR